MSDSDSFYYDDELDQLIPIAPVEILTVFDTVDGDFTLEEKYRLALESIFRWTLRRDEYSDAQLVKITKKVALVALEDLY